MGLSDALATANTSQRRRADYESTALVGSRCQDCSVPAWPSRAVCHQCGSPRVSEEVFSPTGTLITHTMVHIALPGLPAPYMLGQVHLDDAGPLVFAQVRNLEADASVPRSVRVALGGADDSPWYWFEG